MTAQLNLVCLGGGHGLYQTLLAARSMPAGQISAIVTVADDGGSSGRLRRELDMIPPGDLRMALAALAGSEAPDFHEGMSAYPGAEQLHRDVWAKTLQHRFGGTGALAGHAVGNLLIAGLWEVLGSMQAALDKVCELTNSRGRVIPVVESPIDIEAEVAGLDTDPRIIRTVKGQVAIATTVGDVHRVRIEPAAPAASPLAVSALNEAQLITLGPGSWFTSVIPHLLVPDIVQAINSSSAHRVLILNLSAEPGETSGFTAERHLHVLKQHAPELTLDTILVDHSVKPTESEELHLRRSAAQLGANIVFADLSAEVNGYKSSLVHGPHKLAKVLQSLTSG